MWRSKALWAWIVVGLMARAAVFAWADEPHGRVKDDSAEYRVLAINLLEHGVFSQRVESPFAPDSTRQPLYPLFLAAIFKARGAYEPQAVRVAQSVLSLLLIPLAWGCAGSLGRPRAAPWAAGHAAISPALLASANLLLTETLAACVIGFAVLLLYRAIEGRNLTDSLGAGLLFGAATLVRPPTLYLWLAAPLLFIPLIKQSGWRLWLSASLVFALGFALPVGGWMARNWTHHGYVYFTEHGAHFMYYRGAAIEAEARGIPFETVEAEYSARLLQFLKETSAGPRESAQYQTRQARGVVLAHPMLAAESMAKGFARLQLAPEITELASVMNWPWSGARAAFRSGSMRERATGAATLFDVGWQVVWTLMALLGIGLVWRENPRAGWAALCLCGYYAAISSSPQAYARFRLPWECLLAPLAGIGLEWVGGWITSRPSYRIGRSSSGRGVGRFGEG